MFESTKVIKLRGKCYSSNDFEIYIVHCATGIPVIVCFEDTFWTKIETRWGQMKKLRNIGFLLHMENWVRRGRNFQKMHNEGVMGMFLKPFILEFLEFPIADSNSIALLCIILPLWEKINDMGFIGDGVNIVIQSLYHFNNLQLRCISMVKETISTFYMGRVIAWFIWPFSPNWLIYFSKQIGNQKEKKKLLMTTNKS